MLLRKFSWEEEFYEPLQDPDYIQVTKPLNFENQTLEQLVEKEKIKDNERDSFKVHRKPVSHERVVS